MKCFPFTLSTFLMTARQGTSHAESLVFWAYTTCFFRLLRQLRAWFKKLVQHNLTNQSEHANFFVNQERNNILAHWIFPRFPPVTRFPAFDSGKIFLPRADWLVLSKGL